MYVPNEVSEKDGPRDKKILNQGVEPRQGATDAGENLSVPLPGEVDAVAFKNAEAPAQPALAAGPQLSAEVAHEGHVFVPREGPGDPALRSERQGFAPRAVRAVTDAPVGARSGPEDKHLALPAGTHSGHRIFCGKPPPQ